MGFAPSPLTPIIEAKAFCCSFSSPNRMNPYPLLNPLLSRTTMDENQGKFLSALQSMLTFSKPVRESLFHQPLKLSYNLNSI